MSNIIQSEAVFAPNVQRRMLQSLRAELSAKAAAIVGRSAMLRDEALVKDCPQETLDDLNKLCERTRELYQFVREATAPDWPETDNAEFEKRLADTRHDILNKLTPPQNICQWLRVVDQSQYFGAMTEDLAAIEADCKACALTLSQYKNIEFGTAPAPTNTLSAAPIHDTLKSFKLNETPVVSATVLVVDDNPEICEHLAKFLEQQGHNVSTCGDGREALKLMAAREFDLVLLDLVMPELSGYQVLKQMREGQDERLLHTPVIMVSGVTESAHVVACIDAGADDHLPKPPDFHLLRARVDSCLAKRRLREQEFGQFFTPELARHFVRHPQLLKTGRDAEVTVMFCDIRGFSHISERLQPDETVRWLSDVMATFSDCVIEHRGVLVDYIGDELMAMWGAPEELPNHADLACRAALDIIDSLPKLDGRWREFVQDATAVGIGINTGNARVGNTGSHRKFKYGPLGHTVNLASRVQGANKYLRTQLLVTGETQRQLSSEFYGRRLCQIRVVNVDEPVDLFELKPPGGDVTSAMWEQYEPALDAFERHRLSEAAARLGKLLVAEPSDGPSLLLMSRVTNALLQDSAHNNGLDHHFDPIWELPGK